MKQSLLPFDYQSALVAYLDKDGNAYVDEYGNPSTSQMGHLISSILVGLRQESRKQGMKEEQFWGFLKHMTDFCERNSTMPDFNLKEE